MEDPRNERNVMYVDEQLISSETTDIFNLVNLAVLCSLVSTFGLFSNAINIVVFLKQGFVDTVNVSLFALALSDFSSLLTLQWTGLLRNPLFYNSVPLIPTEIYHLTGGWPHGFFATLTSWITAYITLERCLCVLIPLKVKILVTQKLAVSVLTSTFLVLFLTTLPDYTTSYIGWKFDPTHNRSLLGLLFTDGRGQMTVIGFMLGVYTQIIPFLAVVLFTTILVIKIKEISRWRATTSNVGHDSQKDVQKRHIRTVSMVIRIAIIFSVCYVPRIGTYMVACIEAQFTSVGRYGNLFLVVWSFVDITDSINASISIFIYYRMSSNYRFMYHSLLKITVCGKPLRVMKSRRA